jgi:hypothetical protein
MAWRTGRSPLDPGFPDPFAAFIRVLNLELSGGGRNADGLPHSEIVTQQRINDQRAQQAIHRPFQVPRPVLLAVAFPEDQFLRACGKLDLHTLIREAIVEIP